MAIKNWIFAKKSLPGSREIAAYYNIPHFLSDILVNRGYDTVEKAKAIFSPSALALHDPFLMDGMQNAVLRIRQAKEKGERVTVYGDYDVDGITSVSLLYLYLTEMGIEADYYIPDRLTEGYGVNKTAIDCIAERGTTLIVTVDTGITACDEVLYAAQKGIDVVVTDHHECAGALPRAVAVCNPKQPSSAYPFRFLAGVGVVFKLVCALHGDAEDVLKRYADLVALGTIADVMPVTDENRYIIQRGLKTLSKNQKGLYQLMQNAGIHSINDVSVFDVSFLVAPRINAAGRIGDSLQAVKLLVSDNPADWSTCAEYLCELNNRRQMIEANIFAEADALIREKKLYKGQSALVLWKEGWHHGVIGIVASRIKEKYGLPTILFSVSGEKAKGSGRSIEPLSLYSALYDMGDENIQFGGHAMAAGITMQTDYLPYFRSAFCKKAKELTDGKPYVNSVCIDAELLETDLTLDNFEKISTLEPFGAENEVPLFCVKNAILRDMKAIGNQKHMRLVFQVGSKRVNAVYFGMRPELFSMEAQTCVDVVFQASVNEFRDKREMQMIVKAMRPYQKKFLQLTEAIATAISGNIIPKFYPDRKVIANVYRFCKRCVKEGYTLLDIADLPVLMKKNGLGFYDIQSILPSLTVLEEIGVIEHIIVDGQLMVLSFDDSKKVSLEQSPLYNSMWG